MKMYLHVLSGNINREKIWGMDVFVHLFLFLELNGGEWLASRFRCSNLPPYENSSCFLLDMSLDALSKKKSLLNPGI